MPVTVTVAGEQRLRSAPIPQGECSFFGDPVRPGYFRAVQNFSTAAAGAATVFALVARAVGNHQHAALGARRRAFMSITGLR